MKQPKLGNAQLAIMELLWETDQLTARQIRDRLYPDDSSTQHGTVQKLLQRLEEKEFVLRDRTLSVHIFSAAISLQAYIVQQVVSLVDTVTSGSFAPVISHLAEENRISQGEIKEIQAFLDAYEYKGKKKG